MKILKVNHLGIVPKQVETAKSFFTDILKLSHMGKEEVPDQKVHVDFIDALNARLELLSPTHADSPIAKFLDIKGGGIQHVALEVDNLEEWLAYLKEKKVELIDSKGRPGAHHTKIAFIHPRATGGILVELVEQ